MKRYLVIVSCLMTLLSAEPLRQIPERLRSSFTMGGVIPVLDWYIDGSYSETTPPCYSQQEINRCIEKVKRGETSYYGETDTWLYEALKQHSIQGKTVAIIGSVEPWYESVVLAFGGIPYTIEYNKIVTDDPRLHLMTVAEYEKHPVQFDVVLSISSTEHDGLGRYGDPINPTGDLEFMTHVKKRLLKKEGILILAVPVGQDCLVWNAHRIYGPLRFPLLVQEWDIIGTFGVDVDSFRFRLGYAGYQPVFVLKPL